MPPSVSKNKRGPAHIGLQEHGIVKRRKVDDLEKLDIDRSFSAVLKNVIGDEINMMEKLLKSKHRQIQELKSKCLVYEEDIAVKKGDLQRLTNSHKILEAKNLNLTESLSSYQKRKNSETYYQKLKLREDELQGLQKEHNELKSQLSRELNNKAKFESRAIEKDEKILNLRKQNENLIKKCKEIEKFKGQEQFAQIEKHKGRIEDLEHEKKELTIKMERKDAQIIELKAEYDELMNMKKRLENEEKDKEFYRKKLYESEVALKSSKSILEEKCLEMDRLTDSYNEEIAFYRDQGKEFDVKLKNEQSSNEVLETEVKKLEDEIFLLKGTSKEGFSELNDKLKVLKEVNNELKWENSQMEVHRVRMENAHSILLDDYKCLKELHSKCQEPFNAAVNQGDLLSELQKIRNNYDILQTQKNIAESETSILRRKISKLESNDGRKTRDSEIMKYKADFEALTENVKGYKEVINQYKLELFEAKQFALQNSISEHKDIVESLEKMPEKYRRKTVKRLLKKSKQMKSLAGPVSEPTDVTMVSSDKFEHFSAMHTEVRSQNTSKELPVHFQKKGAKKDLPISTATCDDQGDSSQRKNTSVYSNVSKINAVSNTRKESEEKIPANLTEYLENTSSRLANPNPITSISSYPSTAFMKESNSPVTKSAKNDNLSSSYARPGNLPVPSGTHSQADTKPSMPSAPTVNKSPEPTATKHSLLDAVDNFTASLAKQRMGTTEFEVRRTVKKAIEEMGKRGFFMKDSAENKFVNYFMNKFQGTVVISEKQNSEIHQTVRLYATRTIEKLNKSI